MKNRIINILLLLILSISIAGCFNKKGIQDSLSPDLSKPQASVQTGQYDKSIDVAITTATKNDIYYTLDNTEPTKETGKKYEGPIKIEASTILKAVAVNSLNNASAVETWTYLIQGTVGDITIKENGIKDSTKKEIELIAKDDSTAIYYTTDGTEPTESSNLYTEKFQVSNTQIIKAIGTRTQFSNSKVSSLAINIPGTISNPKFNIADGQYETTQDVTITSDTSGAKIYYTTDGTEPTKSSKLYVNPLKVDKTTIIKAIVTKDGLSDSDVVRKSIMINPVSNKIIDLSKIKNIIVTNTNESGVISVIGKDIPEISKNDIVISDTTGAVKVIEVKSISGGLELSVVPATAFELNGKQPIKFKVSGKFGDDNTTSNLSSRKVEKDISELNFKIDPFALNKDLKGCLELSINIKGDYEIDGDTVVDYISPSTGEGSTNTKPIEVQFLNKTTTIDTTIDITIEGKNLKSEKALEVLIENPKLLEKYIVGPRTVVQLYPGIDLNFSLLWQLNLEVQNSNLIAKGLPSFFKAKYTWKNSQVVTEKYNYSTKIMDVKQVTVPTKVDPYVDYTPYTDAKYFYFAIAPTISMNFGLGKIVGEKTIYNAGLAIKGGGKLEVNLSPFEDPAFKVETKVFIGGSIFLKILNGVIDDEWKPAFAYWEKTLDIKLSPQQLFIKDFKSETLPSGKVKFSWRPVPKMYSWLPVIYKIISPGRYLPIEVIDKNEIILDSQGFMNQKVIITPYQGHVIGGSAVSTVYPQDISSAYDSSNRLITINFGRALTRISAYNNYAYLVRIPSKADMSTVLLAKDKKDALSKIARVNKDKKDLVYYLNLKGVINENATLNYNIYNSDGKEVNIEPGNYKVYLPENIFKFEGVDPYIPKGELPTVINIKPRAKAKLSFVSSGGANTSQRTIKNENLTSNSSGVLYPSIEKINGLYHMNISRFNYTLSFKSDEESIDTSKLKAKVYINKQEVGFANSSFVKEGDIYKVTATVDFSNPRFQLALRDGQEEEVKFDIEVYYDDELDITTTSKIIYDKKGPTLVSLSPQNGTNNMSFGETIAIKFSEPLYSQGIKDNVSLEETYNDNRGNIVRNTYNDFTYDEATNTVKYQKKFNSNAKYLLVVKNGLSDKLGNPIAMNTNSIMLKTSNGTAYNAIFKTGTSDTGVGNVKFRILTTNGSPINGVSNMVLKNSNGTSILISNKITTDTSNGSYTITGIPMGSNYTLEIPNFKDSTGKEFTGTSINIGRIDHGVTSNAGNIYLSDNGITARGFLQGKLINSTNGQPIVDAVVMIRAGANVKSGMILAYTTRTNSQGEYTIGKDSTGKGLLPAGNYTLDIYKTNFEKTYYNAVVKTANQTNDIVYVNPIGMTTKQLRVTLSWGANPRDLDLHMTGPKSDGERYYIDYRRDYKRYYENNILIAVHDTDEQNGYGPETITVYDVQDGVYRFYIHNYSGETSITSSNAQLIIVWEGVTRTINIPTTGNGRLWTAFEISTKDGLKLINTIDDSSVSTSRSISGTSSGSTLQSEKAMIMDSVKTKKK